MKRISLLCLCTMLALMRLPGGNAVRAQSVSLKSILYDFEGMDAGISQLPEGDYSYGDLSYRVVPNPLGYSGMPGRQSLELTIAWKAGYGAFGKGVTRYIELNPVADRLNFYLYNPLSNAEDASLTVTVADDDNDNSLEDTADDVWKTSLLTFPRSSAWQLVSLPLGSFTDSNTGGNGKFDIGYTGNNGKLLKVELRFSGATSGTARYYLDMLCFSEGPLRTGAAVTDLPSKSPEDHCYLGAYGGSTQTSTESVPAEFEGIFPAMPGRKIRYVNTFLAFSNSSTTPDNYPGIAVQRLIDKGYTPIITWEPFYAQLAPLDPSQPSLNDIISGRFDSYIDAFADRLKQYTGTVLVRPMHEFDGNWYPWCIASNKKDPAEFVQAFRHLVDRCRARGASNVKWVWCPNSSPSPNASYNWFVNAYPGDSYVDMVATNVYNHPFAGTPDWRTYRMLLTEAYYYAVKYFPHKPFIITETACREREASEPGGSQGKAGWIADMDRDLQSLYTKVRGLIWFHQVKEHDWTVNSSASSAEAYRNNIWLDDYYFFPGSVTGIKETAPEADLRIWPNPCAGTFHAEAPGPVQEVQVLNSLGQVVYRAFPETQSRIAIQLDVPAGLYFVHYRSGGRSGTVKLLVRP
jgi:hypothetical protein